MSSAPTIASQIDPLARKRGRPKRTETREAILHAAVTLFASRGIDAVSTREIAQAVGIASPSLYRHFASIEEIVTEAVRSVTAERARVYERVLAQYRPPREMLKAVAIAAISGFLEDPVALGFYQHLFAPSASNARRLANDTWRHTLNSRIIEVIERASEGVGPDHDSATAYYLLFSFFLGIATFLGTDDSRAQVPAKHREPVWLAERGLQAAIPAIDWEKIAPLRPAIDPA